MKKFVFMHKAIVKMLERKKKHMIKVRLKILYILIYFTVIFLEKNVKMLKKKKKTCNKGQFGNYVLLFQ